MDDLLRRGRDRHQPRGALPIDRHAGNRNWQPGADRRLAGDVVAGRALLQRRAQHHVLDLGRVDAGAPHRLGDDVAGERLRLGVVERAAIGPPDRRAGGRDDDGFAHRVSPGQVNWVQLIMGVENAPFGWG